MRITNNMLINNMMTSMQSNLNRMQKYQNQLATGKKISLASDDPVVAARALRLRTDVSEIAQYKTNVEDATSWMDITETALGEMGDVMHRARELTVEGANGTNTPEELENIKQEISQLKIQMTHLANTTYAGRYVFSGYKTDKALMDEDGNFLINVSNSERIEYEIGIGDDININVTGGDLFNMGQDTYEEISGITTGDNEVTLPLDINATPAGNNSLTMEIDGENITVTIPDKIYSDYNDLASDLQSLINAQTTAAEDISVEVVENKLQFTTGSVGDGASVVIDAASPAAISLGVDSNTQVEGAVENVPSSLIGVFDQLILALENGDNEGLSDLLGDVDKEFGNILRVRSGLGARMNRLELTSNRLDDDNLNFTKLMSQNEDVDIAEAIMNMQNEENVYQASLAVGAKVIMPSLLDFLS